MSQRDSKRPCKSFALTGSCPYGDRCYNAHIKQCTHYQATGACPYGDRCHFAHVRHDPSASALAVTNKKEFGAVDAMRGLNLGMAPFASVERVMTTRTIVGADERMGMSERALPNPKVVEICLCFDTTGSMYSWLDEVRSGLHTLINDLVAKVKEEGALLRVSVMAHGDYCDKDTAYVCKYLPLLDVSKQSERQTIQNFVAEVGPTSGGDGPECYELALRNASRKLTWSADSFRAMVMVGDATPHPVGYSCNGYTNNIEWRRELHDLAQLGVRIYAVQAGRAPAGGGGIGAGEKDQFWQTLAMETEGRWLALKDMRSLAGLITAAVCRELGDEAFERLGRELSARGRMRGELAYVYEEIRTVTVVRRRAAVPPAAGGAGRPQSGLSLTGPGWAGGRR